MAESHRLTAEATVEAAEVLYVWKGELDFSPCTDCTYLLSAMGCEGTKNEARLDIRAEDFREHFPSCLFLGLNCRK